MPQQIGPYQVIARIGEGGMGVVYRARDMRLNRDVALKVLPPAFAEDPSRMARFEREAQMLASLNHPKIAAIYGLEESGSTRALVMELVEGPTLAERIGRSVGSARPRAGSASPAQSAGSGSKTSAPSGETVSRGHRPAVPLDDALPIAQQIAEALEYAHEHGVVHRDLKPANIKITPDGDVKVLDFGLAKAMGPEEGSADLANSPTLSLAMTEAGYIMGTAAYMAPEQARGKPADRRADIWAFGCVLYEMLTGQKAFEGETVSDVLAAVIKSEPDWSALPGDVPPAIQRLLRRCLQKDIRQRVQAIGDARIAIEDMLSGEAGGWPSAVAAGEPVHGGRKSLLRDALPWILAAAGILAAAAFFVLRHPSQPGPLLRKFEIRAGDLAIGFNAHPEISPDGKAIAYISNKDLYVRDLDQLEPRKLYSLSGGNPMFWSPDSQSIGFADHGKLWQIPAAGGTPKQICTLPGVIISAAWGADGTIYFAAWRGDMYRVPADGGDAKALGLLDPKTEVDFHDLSFLPGGRDLMYVVHPISGQHGIEVLAGGKPTTVFSQSGWSVWGASYSPTGHLLFMRSLNGISIWAVPFSVSRLKTTGQPFVVTGNGGHPTVSMDGTLQYLKPPPASDGQLVWVDRSGKIEGTIGQPQKGLSSPALSPDGKRIALVGGEPSGNESLFVYDVSSGVMTSLFSFSPNENLTEFGGPVWTPDGNDILFNAIHDVTEQKIMLVPSDGSAAPHALLTGIVGQLSPQGNLLAYVLPNEDGTAQACYAAFADGKVQDAAAKLQCLPRSPGESETRNRVSPDGHYVAFVVNAAGQSNVYVAHFPSGNGRWQVSTDGGRSPVWSHSGSELFYVAGDQLMSVKVTTQPSLSLSAPVRLFSLTDTHLMGAPVNAWDGPGFDVSADGKSFLMVQRMGEKPQWSMVVDQNWFAEFSSKRAGN